MGNAQQNQQTASLAHRHEQTKRSKSEHRTRGSNNQGMLKSLMCVSAAPPRKLQPKPQSSLRINNEWLTYAKQQLDLMSEESRYILAVKECFINKIDLKACAVQQSQISKMYSLIMWEEGNPEKLVKRIYAEIKLQMKRSDNPVQIINKAFRHYFTLNYRGFVLKMQGNNSDKALQVSELCSKISRETQKLRSESSSQSGSTAADSNEDDNDVRFSDKVMGDVKRMIAVLLFTSFKFYHISPVLSENGQQMFDILKDKLIQLLTKQVLCKNVYKITLTVCREETMQQEKQLRLQYKRLAMRQISTYDLDINPYFLLNEQSPIFTFMNGSLQSMLSQSMTQAQQMRIFEMQLDQQLITEEDESFALTQSESRISNENFSDSGDDEPHAFRKTNAGVTKRSNQVEDGQVAQKVAEEDDPNDPLRYDSKALQDYLQNELATIKDITDQFKASKIDIEERLKVKPYARVVNKLRELRLYEDPIKKVKQIMKARDLIPICINEFWRGIEIQSDKLVLDADQMLSIMTYAISQSAMADLSCHLRLIQEFTSTDLQNSKMGQALFTVRAALENFCDGVKIAHIQNQYIMQAGSSGSIRAARSCLSSTFGETSASTSTVTCTHE